MTAESHSEKKKVKYTQNIVGKMKELGKGHQASKGFNLFLCEIVSFLEKMMQYFLYVVEKSGSVFLEVFQQFAGKLQPN